MDIVFAFLCDTSFIEGLHDGPVAVGGLGQTHQPFDRERQRAVDHQFLRHIADLEFGASLHISR